MKTPVDAGSVIVVSFKKCCLSFLFWLTALERVLTLAVNERGPLNGRFLRGIDIFFEFFDFL